MTDDDAAAEVYNRAVNDFIRLVVGPMVRAGATPEQLLVMMESSIVGVALTIVKLGGDERVVDSICEGAKRRLAEMRLTGIEPSGSA